MTYKYFILTFFTVTSLFLNSQKAYSKYIVFGVDTSYWYPYTFIEGSSVKGIQIDYVKKACEILGHTARFKILPWDKCVEFSKKGKINGIVSISYTPERAKKMIFPAIKGDKPDKSFCLTTIAYYIISLKKKRYQYKGDLSTIPQPVFIPYEYSIGETIKKNGIKISYLPGIEECFKRLLSVKKGSTIITLETAKYFINSYKNGNDFYIQDIPVKEKSYFLAFSKKNPGLSPQEQSQLWKKIRELHYEIDFLVKLTNKYPTLQFYH